jgi:hypothetical protein
MAGGWVCANNEAIGGGAPGVVGPLRFPTAVLFADGVLGSPFLAPTSAIGCGLEWSPFVV